MRRLNRPHRLYNYIGARNASPSTLVAQLPAVIGAERALRRLNVTADTLLLHRQASPLSSGSLESQLLTSANRSLYDFDDALQWDIRHGLRSAVSKPDKAERCVRAADIVIAGSELLADWASRSSKSVFLVPSCVEPDDYPTKSDYRLSGPPVLGWVGSPATERYLRGLTEPLLALHRSTSARLVVVSAGDASLGPLDVMTDRVPWDSATVGAVMTSFDFALAPLTVDLFARGKCAYKILQYAAAGLPIVGAPVGANKQVLGRLGAFAARSDSEWLQTLQDLIAASPSEREAIGQTSSERVQQYYSFEAWEDVMIGLLAPQPASNSR